MPKSFESSVLSAMDPNQVLSSQVHLGKYIYSRGSGNLNYTGHRPGFRPLTRDELKQLMRRLRAAPESCIKFLDLCGHEMGADMIREIAPPIAELEGLVVLILSCTCLSPLPAACVAFPLSFCAWLLSFLLSFPPLRLTNHSLQIMPWGPPDAARSQRLCHTSRRFKSCISAVIDVGTFVFVCILIGGQHHALQGVYLHALLGNAVGPTGCYALAKALTHLSALQELYLSSN
jgi:hypothetical protein